MSRRGRDFNNNTNIGDDSCEMNSRDAGNAHFANYYLQSDFTPSARHPSAAPAFTDVGIFPSVADNKFSIDVLPRPGDTSKASKLANTRPFVTMPFMGAGQTSIVNPDADSALTRGGISNSKKMYNPAPLKSNTYRPMPMIEGIRREIQNPVHIIPEFWQRGGIDTRAQIRAVSYAKEKCIQPNKTI